MSKVKVLLFNFALLAFGYMFLFYNADPPDQRTGAPSEGTCGDCHSGGSFTGSLEIIGLPSSINAGDAYNITVRVTNLTGNASKAGFQLVALNGNNTNAGNLIALSSDHGTTTSGGRKYVDHRGGKLLDASKQAEWTFQWVAPSDPNGTSITMYCAALMANGNGNNTGDNYILKSMSGTIVNIVTPVEVTLTGTNLTCNQSNDGTATANPSGGIPPYTFKWSGAKTTQTIENLSAGTYHVTVTDMASQTASGQIAITQPQALNVALSGEKLDCINTQTTIKSTVVGGTAGYSYTWNTSETSSSINTDVPGLYSVTVTDNNGCSKSASINILQDISAPVISIDPPNLISCAEPVIQLNASVSPSNAQLLWTTNDGFIVSGKNAKDPLVNKPGIYVLTATNASNGCSTIKTVEVKGVIPMVHTDTLNNVNCFGDSTGQISITTTGGLAPYTYKWSNGADSSFVDSLKAGMYYVAIKDSSTCNDTLYFEIQQSPKLNVVINSTNVTGPGLSDGTAAVSPSGGTPKYNILWSTNDSTNYIKNLGIGNYSVTVTDSLSCKVSQTVVINPFDCGMSVNANEIKNVSCFGGNDGAVCPQVIGGTSPYAYLWSNDSISACLTNLVQGIYSVSVTDSVGCKIIKQFEILQPPQIILPDSLIVKITETGFGFADGTATISPKGGTLPYSYQFDNGTNNGTKLSSGKHTVTITDANNCMKIVSFEMPSYPCDSLGIKSINLDISIFCKDAPGTVKIVSVLGGVAPYTYKWNNGTTAPIVTDLYSKINNVIITDAKNCASKFFTSIQPPDTLVIDFDITNASPGKKDGKILAKVSGGLAPYKYVWSIDGVGNSNPIIDLAAGTYCVTIVDFNGCSVKKCAEVKTNVGTSDLIADGWKLYPNPARDFLYLKKALPDAENLQWKIFDFNGQLLKYGDFANSSGLLAIPVGEIVSGSYILYIQHRSKELVTHFMIQ